MRLSADFIKSKGLYCLAIVLAAIPILSLLGLLVKYSVNLPWEDQLPFVNLMSKLDHHTLSIYDLWAQHNEHRILVPQAVELIIGKLTSFNFRVFVFMNFITATASFTFLLLMLRSTFKNSKMFALLVVPFAWLFFSPIQWVNWVWGFQLAFYMCIFSTIFTIWLLTRPNLINSQKLFIATLAMASITTYCNGNGMLIWPIGFFVLLRRKFSYQKLLQWAGVGLILIGSYLYKFRRSPDSPTLAMLIKEPVAVLNYIFTYLGRNLSTTPDGSKYIGIILLIILALSTYLIYKKGKLDRVVTWLALAAYVILTACLAAISRLNFGVNHSFLSNSYPTISVIFILAVIAITAYAALLTAKDFTKPKLSLYLTGFFTLGVLSALPLSAFFTNYTKGAENLRALGIHMRSAQNCLYNATSKNDECLLKIFPDKTYAWDRINDLKKLHWGDFR